MPDREPEQTASTPNGIGKRKVAVGAVVFLALTVAVFAYQFGRIDPTDAGPTWSGLQWRFAIIILLALPLEAAATTARIWFVCRVLHPGVSILRCFGADCANMGLAMITPSQTGGGFAQIYMLHRAGVSVGTSLTISLLSFLGTLVGLLCMGLYSILVGGAGQTAGALFSVAVWTTTISVGLMFVAAFVPGVFRAAIASTSRGFCRLANKTDRVSDWRTPAVDRMGPFAAKLADILYTYRRDAWRFLRAGKLAFVWVVLCTFGFLLARCIMAYLAVRFLGIEAGFTEVVAIQVPLIFIVYFAPTPGSAGIAEGASFLAMGGIVTVGFAPYYNLIWRFTTGYLQALIGLLLLSRALILDGRKAIRAVRSRREGVASP